MDDGRPKGARFARMILAVLVLTTASARAQGGEPAGPSRGEASTVGEAPKDPHAWEQEPIKGFEDVPKGRGRPETTGSGEVSVLPFFLWTGVIVLAICGALVLVRRVFPGARSLFPNPAINVIGRRAITGSASVVLVEVGNRILRLGVSKDSLLYMGDITDPLEIALVKGKAVEARPDSATRTFREELAAGVKEGEEAPKPPPPTTEEREGDIRAELDQIKRTLEGWKA